MAEQKMYIAARDNDIDTIQECIAKKKDQNYDSENRHVGSHAFIIALTKEYYKLAEYIFENITLDTKVMEDSNFIKVFNAPFLAESVIHKFPKETQNYILRHGITKYFSIVKNLPNLYLNNAMLHNAVKDNNLEILELFNSNPALYNDTWKELIDSLGKYKLLLDPNKKTVQIILNSEYSRQNNYSLNQLIQQNCFNIELVDYLINLGADLNLATKQYPNPLAATANIPLKEAQELFIHLIKLGSEINLSTREQLPYLYYLFNNLKTYRIVPIYFNKLLTALKYGADPFITIYPENSLDGVPLLHYFIANITNTPPYKPDSIIHLLDIISFTQNDLNVLDSWGRNLLFHISTNSYRHYSTVREITRCLIQLGVDPDHRALIDDEKKVTLAKIKGTLPKDYGKTPRELLQEKGLQGKPS